METTERGDPCPKVGTDPRLANYVLEGGRVHTLRAGHRPACPEPPPAAAETGGRRWIELVAAFVFGALAALALRGLP